MRVFLTLMCWSNENKNCMGVDENSYARVCMRVFSTLMSLSNKNNCIGDAIRVALELMRVNKREFE